MYVMNIDMPAARLGVLVAIEQQHSSPVDYNVTLREGISQ
jgi:hypothetical protein